MALKNLAAVVAVGGLALLSPGGLAQATQGGDTFAARDASSGGAAAEHIPGASTPAAEYQLTDAVLADLRRSGAGDVSLFDFAAASTGAAGDDGESPPSRRCKVFPGDADWPGPEVWETLDRLSEGALIKTVPIGAACFESDEHYDEARCAELIANWSSSDTHDEDPTSVMSPIYQGATCMPQDGAAGGPNATCTLGGFPVYSLNATTVAHVQLAVNLARNAGVRLVVRNTGHDFLGRNTGAGALGLWTHALKSVEFIERYEGGGGDDESASSASSSSSSGNGEKYHYDGPAFKIGAGVQVFELYEAAHEKGFTAVGGECGTVGMAGGYLAGGGHSPISPLAGLGVDHVLSIDLVTPDGRFITADDHQNQELFWALRGGGGATFGVVTSMTVKVEPKIGFAGMTFKTQTNETGMSDAILWGAIQAYWRRFPEFSAARSYGYSKVFKLDAPAVGHSWTMLPFMAPHLSLPDFKRLVAPLLADWEALGFRPAITWFEHDDFYAAWRRRFPAARVGVATMRTANRLIPARNWADPALLNATVDALQSILDEPNSAMIMYNINAAAPAPDPETSAAAGAASPNAGNPAWRDAAMFAIVGATWPAGASPLEVERANTQLTRDWMERLRRVTVLGGGGYGNEGDVMEPDFAGAFFGHANYPRLRAAKRAVDPWGVFWAPTAVGSEDWLVEGQPDWLVRQTGRLCRR